jgi:predicted enzyme related to lactoylglutathione lyase
VGLQPDTLVFDCAAPIAVATFWAAALGYELDPTSDEDDAYIGDPSGRTAGIFFQKVPESKVAKNRLHLDVRPTGTMQEEVDRLLGLGGSIRGFIEEGGSFWTQMRDPEGNEFCVLRGPGDGWTPGEL